jgi:hypothetical protein
MNTTNLDEAIPVIMISTFSHSGSTLLDLLIGSHSRVISGGEFEVNERVLRKRCTCGADHVRTCPFWKTVIDQLQDAGVEFVSPEYYVGCPLHLTQYLACLFPVMLKVSGTSHVLCSPKNRNRWFPSLHRSEKFNLHVIFLTREPLGLLASHRRKGANFLWTILRINSFYLRQLLDARFATAHLRYEAFAENPKCELGRIMSALHLSFEEDQLKLGNKAAHNLGGNGIRRRPIEDVRLDDSWKTSLSFAEKIVGGLLTVPARLFVWLAEKRIGAFC